MFTYLPNYQIIMLNASAQGSPTVVMYMVASGLPIAGLEYLPTFLHDYTHPLHYITLHSITLHYITVHDMTWYDMTSHYITSHSIRYLHTFIHCIHTDIHTSPVWVQGGTSSFWMFFGSSILISILKQYIIYGNKIWGCHCLLPGCQKALLRICATSEPPIATWAPRSALKSDNSCCSAGTNCR